MKKNKKIDLYVILFIIIPIILILFGLLGLYSSYQIVLHMIELIYQNALLKFLGWGVALVFDLLYSIMFVVFSIAIIISIKSE